MTDYILSDEQKKRLTETKEERERRMSRERASRWRIRANGEVKIKKPRIFTGKEVTNFIKNNTASIELFGRR
jgi:predicted metal-dependent hydrolase